MNARNLLVGLTLVVLTLLIWELRWVLLVLFGAVVLAVALDVPIERLQRWGWPRPLALAVVLLAMLLGGSLVIQLLVPELITQIRQLGALVPVVVSKLQTMLASQPQLQSLEPTSGGGRRRRQWCSSTAADRALGGVDGA